MKKIYVTEYIAKNPEKDLYFDTCAEIGFDKEKVLSNAESAWLHTTIHDKKDVIFLVNEYDYDDSHEEVPGELDSAAILWDEGGKEIKRFVLYRGAELTGLYNSELVEYETSLDYRDPDVIEEILDRAEFYEDGIKQAYEDACDDDDPELYDSILERAKSYLI